MREADSNSTRGLKVLKAIIHNKNSRFYERYLPGRRGLQDGEKRRTQEDEITSMMIGPLDYQPTAIVWKIFVSWLSKIDPLKVLPSDIDSVEINFWKSQNKVEPDVLVCFKSKAELWTFLIEAKWHSGQSGKDQIEKQQREYCKDKERFFHLALMKHKNDLPNIQTDMPLLRTTYAEYIAVIGEVARKLGEDKLAKLAYDLQQLADKLQLDRHFTGFGWLEQRPESFSGTMRFFKSWNWQKIVYDTPIPIRHQNKFFNQRW